MAWGRALHCHDCVINASTFFVCALHVRVCFANCREKNSVKCHVAPERLSCNYTLGEYTHMEGAPYLAARCEEARSCASAYTNVLALSGCHPPVVAPACPARRRAWATLLTNKAYAPGVRALHNSIVKVDSDFELVVMVTNGVPAGVCDDLRAHGCKLVEVPWLPPPPGAAKYAAPQFTECWTKLRAWELDFEVVVLLDADMVVVRNMDELLTDVSLPMPTRPSFRVSSSTTLRVVSHFVSHIVSS